MITAYTGLPGNGKTLSMTLQAYKYWKIHKCPVFSNYNLRFPINKPEWKFNRFEFPYMIYRKEKQLYHYPYLVYGKDFLDVFKQVKDAIILIDECGSVFDNRKWQNFDTWIMRRFRESRHHNLEILYTAQSIKDVDPKIRQLTNFECKCTIYKFRKKPIYLKNDFYHNEVIVNDTAKNRKEFKIMSDFLFGSKKFEFIYQMYDTYEDLIYDQITFKPISELIKPNIFELQDGNSTP